MPFDGTQLHNCNYVHVVEAGTIPELDNGAHPDNVTASVDSTLFSELARFVLLLLLCTFDAY